MALWRKPEKTKSLDATGTQSAAIRSEEEVRDEILRLYAGLSSVQKRACWLHMRRSLTPQVLQPQWPPPGATDEQRRELAIYQLDAFHNAQSIGFMIELISRLTGRMAQLPRQAEFTVLDVGCRTGAGSSLLGEAFPSHFTYSRLAVDTLDIDPTFREYQIARWPYIRQARIGNLFDLEDNSYDIVVCSHTIEHFRDPGPFVRKLQSVGRLLTAVYCPYNESNPISGHFCISPEFVDSFSPLDKEIFDSWWWRKGAEQQRQQVVYFTLRGSGYAEAS